MLLCSVQVASLFVSYILGYLSPTKLQSILVTHMVGDCPPAHLIQNLHLIKKTYIHIQSTHVSGCSRVLHAMYVNGVFNNLQKCVFIEY